MREDGYETETSGQGRVGLRRIPENRKHLITARYLPRKKRLNGKEYPYSVSVWYVDILEDRAYASDGVAVYTDKYLDVIFTPEGDGRVDDRDELDAAYASGELSREQYEAALAEGEAVVRELCGNVERTEIWCSEILAAVMEELAPVKR